jgi:hypothetical protein
MAFAMTVQGLGSVLNPALFRSSAVIPPIQLADQAFTTAKASTAVQNLGFGNTRFRIVLYIKTLVLGANTNANQGPIFFLEAADNSGMSTNLTLLDYTQAYNIASATEVQCLELVGLVPIAAKQFCRITVDPTLMGAGSSGTYDALIEACP